MSLHHRWAVLGVLAFTAFTLVSAREASAFERSAALAATGVQLAQNSDERDRRDRGRNDDRDNDRRDRGRDDDRRDRNDRTDRRDDRRDDRRYHVREDRRWHRDQVIVVPKERRRVYRHITVVRPYGRWYTGYGRYHRDAEAFKWLAFTAITLRVLEILNEAQERAHEDAQIRATTAPVGEVIHWNQGNATGSVVATREGTSSSGRYCREFQQEVRIDGRFESAYGTACLQPDGTWEVVSTR
jgi:hypothetical protein